MPKNKKTRNELTLKLNTGIKFIADELERMESLSYEDPMRFEIATVIATKLRVLVLDSGNNHSLLNQLGIKERLLFPVEFGGIPDIASNLLFSSRLLGLKTTAGNKLYCTPLFSSFSHRLSCTFSVWINEIVIDTKGDNAVLVTRNDVIRTLADKEGGAHEDPFYQEDYYRIKDNSGFCIIDSEGKEHSLANNYYVECLVVIANELIDAITIYTNYIDESQKTVEKTRFNAIQLTYSERKGKYLVNRNRYYPNTNEKLRIAIMVAFDHYRDAEYALVFLNGHIYTNHKHNLISKFLVIDQNDSKKLVYLRSDENDNITAQALLLECGNGYTKINEDSDIYKNQEPHPLEYFIEKLSKGNSAMFDDYLRRQMIVKSD